MNMIHEHFFSLKKNHRDVVCNLLKYFYLYIVGNPDDDLINNVNINICFSFRINQLKKNTICVINSYFVCKISKFNIHHS